ncbi:MAG: hypothetical protein J6Q39_04185 [Bacteroidales bacterium]|nr:hypothetical protein [Bacteroidales bacterium]
MRVEVGKAYKLQDGRDCFCYLRDKWIFYIVVQPPKSSRYDTFTVDEQGVVLNDRKVFGERLLPFTGDVLDGF